MDEENLLSDWFDSCRTELQAAAATWCQAASTALEGAHGAADSMRCASRLYHARRALDRMQPFLPKRLVELLESSMSERFGGVSAPFRGMALSDDVGLVDDDVVNESIEVSRIAARVLVETEWEIREAEQGLSRQLGRKVAGERDSPFHPETYARVVWRLTEEMSLNAEERADCLRVAPDAIVEFARRTCASAIAWFGRADATAGFVVKRSSHQHGPVAIPVDVAISEPGADADIVESAPVDGASLDPSQDLRPLDARDQVFRGVISGIDAVLSDFRFTPELRRVLSGLQMAVMRFAFGSPETLYAPEHRLWSVSRKLAEYALANCLRDRLAHDDFILFADHTIQALLPLDTRSLRDIAPYLDAIDNFVRTRPQHLLANEENAMHHLARLEDGRRKVLGAAINRHRNQIDALMGHTEMPFRLRQFMLVDWAEVLARTELTEGAESGTYAEYWDAAQCVVAQVQASATARVARSSMDISPLLEVLERGMASVSVPSVEKHELAAAFVRPDALARHEWLETDLQPASAYIIGAEDRSRKPFWGAREFEGESPGGASTGGYVSAMPASDAERWVNALRRGSVIELFLLGTWLEARVMSISGAGNLFMFKDELGGNSHPLTRRALLRLVREGLAGPL